MILVKQLQQNFSLEVCPAPGHIRRWQEHTKNLCFLILKQILLLNTQIERF